MRENEKALFTDAPIMRTILKLAMHIQMKK